MKMKTLSCVVLFGLISTACTSQIYNSRGDAKVLASKYLSQDQVELTVQRDNGEVVQVVREYDAHAVVGARIYLADPYEKRAEDVTTIRRYEFK